MHAVAVLRIPPKGVSVSSDLFPGNLATAPAPYTYDVSGELSGFTIGTLRDAVSQAFALWAEETPLAFVRTFSNPGITITFRPLGVGGGLGNALIEINSSMSFRYGDTQSGPTNTYDLVTVLAHEIGHRLGLDHSTDPSSIMFESVGNSKAVRTLPAVDIQAIRRLDGPPDIVEATGVHGTSVIIEDPQQISSVTRQGMYARIDALNAATWFHFTPATPVLTQGREMRLHAVRLKVRTQSRISLSLVHVWDDSAFLQVHRLGLRGETEGSRLWDLRFGIARKPLVRDGIAISLNVDFINAGSSQIDLISAGCEFVPASSVADLPVIVRI
jgi:hypothetical protein